MGFFVFLLFFVLTIISCGFEIQAVMLSNLTPVEGFLYSAAKIVLAFGLLFVSIKYRQYKSAKMWGYVALCVAYMILCFVFQVWNVGLGRYVVAVNSDQKYTADVSESEALAKAADKKADAAGAGAAAASAHTQASKRFANSYREGSLRSQVAAAGRASRDAAQASQDADQSVALATQAAQIKRDAGFSEAQAVREISPFDDRTTLQLNAFFFAVVLQLLELLTAGGAADYLVGLWAAQKINAGRASKRGLEYGRVRVDPKPVTPDAPFESTPPTPNLPSENEAREAQEGAGGAGVRSAKAKARKPVKLLITDDEIESVRADIKAGVKPGQEYIKGKFCCAGPKANEILRELERLNVVRRHGRVWRGVTGIEA